MTQNVINLGTFTAPYREFNLTVPAGSIVPLRYDHQIIEILENNLPDNIECCFGGVGGFTKLQTGIAYRYPDNNIIPYVQFHNTGATTAYLKVAVAVGQILDNRLVLYGITSVQSSQQNPIYNYSDVYTDSTAGKKTIDASGSVTISDYTSATDGFKTVLIQNTSSADVRLEDATDGFILAPTATFEWKVPSKAITVYGTNGQTLWVEGYK